MSRSRIFNSKKYLRKPFSEESFHLAVYCAHIPWGISIIQLSCRKHNTTSMPEQRMMESKLFVVLLLFRSLSLPPRKKSSLLYSLCVCDTKTHYVENGWRTRKSDREHTSSRSEKKYNLCAQKEQEISLTLQLPPFDSSSFLAAE